MKYHEKSVAPLDWRTFFSRITWPILSLLRRRLGHYANHRSWDLWGGKLAAIYASATFERWSHGLILWIPERQGERRWVRDFCLGR
jgi:hypothetical protein